MQSARRVYKMPVLALLMVLAGLGTPFGRAVAEPANGPLFYDQRRLPDMEVERRNQEVIDEQRRVSAERRNEAEAMARKRAKDASRLADAEKKAEEQRKAEEEKRVAAEAEMTRKAEEDKRVALEAETKRKAEEERQRVALDTETKRKAVEEQQRVALEAETKRKAEEEKQRVALEAETKRKAEEEKQRVALEAETKRKAEEEKQRVALEAETKRKAVEEQQRVALEAETKRKAEEERQRVALEAETKRKAEEEKQVAAAAVQRAPAQTAALVPAITNSINTSTAPAGSCEAAKVSASPLAGGRLQIAIDSPCRRAQNVTLRYGSYDFVRRLGPGGQATLVLDLFMGHKGPATLSFADGSNHNLDTGPGDLTATSKVALIWQSPVDLDLHAIEGGGAFGKPGHRWPGAASTVEAAQAEATGNGRGAGFVSSIDDGGHEGTKIEVYTFVHSAEQESGAVSMLIDYVSRGAKPTGEMCGSGALAEIPFTVVVLDHKGQTTTENGIVPAAKCGETLTGNARYLRGALPDLRFRN